MQVELPKSEIKQAKVGSCAVLLQTESESGLPGRHPRCRHHPRRLVTAAT